MNRELLIKDADTAVAPSCKYSLSSATKFNDKLFPILLLTVIGTVIINNMLYVQLTDAQKCNSVSQL